MSNTKRLKQYSKFILLPLVIIIGAILLIYVLINLPALWQKLDFEYKTKIKGEDPASSFVFLPNIEEGNFRVESEENREGGQLLDNHLYIPKIGVSAPVIWEVGENDIMKKLEDGVAHYEGSKLPSQNGNVFITGHSSYFWWNRGGYKTVFVLLPKMSTGDKILITYGGQVYKYEVKETFVVRPDQVDVTYSNDKDELTLSTCVPVGTTISRFIVKADLIDKKSAQNDQPVRKKSAKGRSASGGKKTTRNKPQNKTSESIILLTSIFF